MKERIRSFWALAARNALPWTLRIGLVMTIAEPVLFRLLGWQVSRLEFAVSESKLSLVFTLAMAGLCAALCLGGLLRVRDDLPLQRLRLGRNGAFWILAGENASCFLILWAWQTVLAIVLALWCASGHADLTGAHTLFVTSYRVRLLHALLPLGDWLLWARNIVMILALGMTTAKAALTRHVTGPLVAGLLGASIWPASTESFAYIGLIIQILFFLFVAWFAWDVGKRGAGNAQI